MRIMRCETSQSVEAIPAPAWTRLAAGRGPDASHGYLRFREELEPGEPVAIAATDDTGELGAAVSAVATAPGTALFTDPWKLLTAQQFRRLSPDEDADAVQSVVIDLLAQIGVDPGNGEEQALAEGFARTVGPALVVRGYDASEVLTAKDLDERGRYRATRVVVAELMRLVREGRAGAVAFPFVRAGDDELREVLRQAGFVAATLTAATVIDVSSYVNFQSFLEGQTPKVRRRYMDAQGELNGLTVTEVSLDSHVEEITDLEAHTLRKNGGQPDVTRLRRARRLLAGTLPDAVRTVAAMSGGVPVACSIYLMGGSSGCALAYGCSYPSDGRSVAYHYLTFNDPVAQCILDGIPAYRVGFEAFATKRWRGARLQRREMWLWTPDPRQLGRIGRLVRFLNDRNLRYFSRYLED